MRPDFRNVKMKKRYTLESLQSVQCPNRDKKGVEKGFPKKVIYELSNRAKCKLKSPSKSSGLFQYTSVLSFLFFVDFSPQFLLSFSSWQELTKQS